MYPYQDGNQEVSRHVDGAGFGKVAIITGCASGVGLATTQLFLSHQYQVFGVDISEMDYAKIDTRDQERFHFHRADLLKEGQCDEVVRGCVAQYGDKIEVLANVAGVMDSFESAETVTDAQWDRVIGVNLTVPTKMIRAVMPMMKANKKGSIINISSKAGSSGAAAGVAYTASKHGLLGVTKQTAWRFRKEGIRCNAVMPGAIDTNIFASLNQTAWDQEGYSHLKPVHDLHIPAGQKSLFAPAEVANLILFLASDQSSMISGAALPIDQAWSTI